MPKIIMKTGETVEVKDKDLPKFLKNNKELIQVKVGMSKRKAYI